MSLKGNTHMECLKAKMKLDTKIAPTPKPWIINPTQVSHSVLLKRIHKYDNLKSSIKF